MTNVTEFIYVRVPLSAVHKQWMQFEAFPQFMDGAESIEQLDDTHLHWSTSIGGVAREFDTEITEQHADERVAWKSTDGLTHRWPCLEHQLRRERAGRARVL